METTTTQQAETNDQQEQETEEVEGYYCGLCGCFMPISHFPH